MQWHIRASFVSYACSSTTCTRLCRHFGIDFPSHAGLHMPREVCKVSLCSSCFTSTTCWDAQRSCS